MNKVICLCTFKGKLANIFLDFTAGSKRSILDILFMSMPQKMIEGKCREDRTVHKSSIILKHAFTVMYESGLQLLHTDKLCHNS